MKTIPSIFLSFWLIPRPAKSSGFVGVPENRRFEFYLSLSRFYAADPGGDPYLWGMDVTRVSSQLKQALLPLYGNRFSLLVLYGSYARRDFTPDSDLDFMVVLKDREINAFREIARANTILVDFQLEHGKVFSLTATTEEKLNTMRSGFYHFVRKEGIEVA